MWTSNIFPAVDLSNQIQGKFTRSSLSMESQVGRRCLKEGHVGVIHVPVLHDHLSDWATGGLRHLKPLWWIR